LLSVWCHLNDLLLARSLRVIADGSCSKRRQVMASRDDHDENDECAASLPA
jgi:hypothetical protein